MLKYISLFLALILLTGCAPPEPAQDSVKQTVEKSLRSVSGIEDEIQTLPDGTKYLVHPDKILGGGPPKDGIPSIDDPKYITVDEADEFIADDELAMIIDRNGVKKVYPFQILVWHEIVNDFFGDEAILVTYCPLCFTSLAFVREFDGEVVEFGTSGKLFNSELVMYDRKTDTYWNQGQGLAILGELTGQKLKRVPLDVTTWGAIKEQHADAQVLSRDTGYLRSYGTDPYGGYYTSNNLFFSVEHEDDRLHRKTITIGMEFDDGSAKAYPVDEVEKAKIVNEDFGGKQYVVFWDTNLASVKVFSRVVDGNALTFTHTGTQLIDETGTVWNFDGEAISGELAGKQLDREAADFGFWFAWVVFRPETEVFFAE